MLGQTLRMKKKRVTHPSQALWDTQILFCDKYTLLQRGSVYTKKLAGWLTDWLIDWLKKQADRQLYFAAYCFKTLVSFLAGGGGGWHTYIIIYK